MRKQITLFVKEREFKALKELADKKGCSVAKIITEMVTELVEAHFIEKVYPSYPLLPHREEQI